MDDILEAIKQSEFSFARSASDVPFFPVGWLQDNYYSAAEFEDQEGVRPTAEVTEHTFSAGAVLPVYVAKRDMWVLGGDLAWDRIDIQQGPYQDQSVLRVTPVAAWLHQYGEKDMVGIFVAPIFSKEQRADQAWATSGYGGVVALHWYSDQFQLLYGGVYEYSFGQHALYPYAGRAVAAEAQPGGKSRPSVAHAHLCAVAPMAVTARHHPRRLVLGATRR